MRLLGIVFHAPLHLFHELKHLLGREAGDGLGNRLRGCLGGNWRAMEGRLEGGEGEKGGESGGGGGGGRGGREVCAGVACFKTRLLG